MAFTSSASAQQGNYVDVYYPLIRKAEISITNHAYREALQFYKQAFSEINHSFAIDYYNATLCELQLQAYSKAGKYAGKLMDKGVDTLFFQSPVFEALRTHKKWDKQLQTYPAIRAKYISRIDTSLYKEIVSMVENTQSSRRRKDDYSSYREEIRRADSANMSRIKQIIAQFGYPDENLIGIHDNNFFASPLSVIILRHHYQNGYTDLPDILLEQVKRGKLSAREYAQYEDINLATYKDTYFTKLDTSIIIEQKLVKETINWINQKRISIGLEPLDEWKRKILFELNETLFLPFKQFNTVRPNGFCFLASYGVVSFIGDKTFNDQFLQQVPQPYLLQKNVLEEQGIKYLKW